MGRSSLVLLVLAACATSPAPAPAPIAPARAAPVASPPPPAVGFRLPDTARPTAYRMTLTVDPTREELIGEGEIDVVHDVDGPLYLNGRGLTVESATFQQVPVAAHPVDDDMIAFADLPAGAGTLRLRWKARIDRNESQGAFAQKFGSEWYVFTHLEAVGARRVFPCFDEPAYKVPFELTLRVPRGLTALGNTPVAEQRDVGEQVVVRFQPTPPLPSYLLAFAVGAFELVDAGTTKSGVPIRVAAPRGHAADTAIAVEDTRPILERLEDYFGMPYPFAKLDLVPIPDTVSFGAMENPGLVTYHASILLTPEAERTSMRQRSFVDITAHELAHQWFGNLVTMAWWDDIWLNEAFASWLGEKIMEEYQPEWGTRLYLVNARGRIIDLDSSSAARRVREPVGDENQLRSAFDGITYSKGESVLTMLEAWLGPEVFRAGLRTYMTRHARGNATYADFAAALSEAAGRDVKAVVDSFVEQTGAPLIELGLRCEGTPTVTLAQRRFVPLGASLDADRVWQVPIRVAWRAGKKSGVASALLTGKDGELILEGAPRCPDLVVPDPEGVGYFHWLGRGPIFDRLLDKRVLREQPPAVRLGVAASVRAGVTAGERPYRDSMQLAMALLDDPERRVKEVALTAASGVGPWLSPELRGRYQAWVRRTYGPLARKLGFARRPGETHDTFVIRHKVLWRMAFDGDDPATLAEAVRLTWRWFDDPKAISPEMLDTTLWIAARGGDARLLERYLAGAREAHARGDKVARERLLDAMTFFRGAELEARVRGLALSDEFPAMETYGLAVGVGRYDADGQERAFTFVTENYETLRTRRPEEARADLIGVAEGRCSSTSLDRTRAFFTGRIEKELTGALTLAKLVDRETRCIALRRVVEEGLAGYLK